MGRHKLHRTAEELREKNRERQRRYYARHKDELNRVRMERYYEKKKMRLVPRVAGDNTTAFKVP